jgi:hypothetical protein
MSPVDPDSARVYAILRAGGLALVPTDVGYGLLAMEAGAVERIYELKGRPATKPCVTVANEAILADVALPVGAGVVAWLRDITRTLPLAVVARLDPDSRLLASMAPFVRAQATHEGTIAAFFSAGVLVEAVAELARLDVHEAGRDVVGLLVGRGRDDVQAHEDVAREALVDVGEREAGRVEEEAPEVAEVHAGVPLPPKRS